MYWPGSKRTEADENESRPHRSLTSMAFRPMASGQLLCHPRVTRPGTQPSQCPSPAALVRKSAVEPAWHSGLPTADSSTTSSEAHKKHLRFPCQPANRCRICHLLESVRRQKGLRHARRYSNIPQFRQGPTPQPTFSPGPTTSAISFEYHCIDEFQSKERLASHLIHCTARLVIALVATLPIAIARSAFCTRNPVPLAQGDNARLSQGRPA